MSVDLKLLIELHYPQCTPENVVERKLAATGKWEINNEVGRVWENNIYSRNLTQKLVSLEETEVYNLKIS